MEGGEESKGEGMKLRASKKSLAAEHEAAHAVMMKLCGLPATELAIDEDGGGSCEGTNLTIRADTILLVTLAGMVWESGCRFTLIDWEKVRFTFDDAGVAWQLVSDFPLLCQRVTLSGELTVEEPAATLNRWFAKAGDILKPHKATIRRLGKILEDEGSLSPRQVASILLLL